MAYKATRVEMSYDFNRTVPPEDPEMVFLNKFKEQFGEDGNIIAVGVLDSAIYELKNFAEFKKLGDSIRSIPGVNNVFSLPQIKIIFKDTANVRFRFVDLFPKQISSQKQFDSLMAVLRTQKFYMGQIVNTANYGISGVDRSNSSYAAFATWINISGLHIEGDGPAGAIALVLYAATFPFILNTWTGVRSVNRIWIRAAEAMGAAGLNSIHSEPITTTGTLNRCASPYRFPYPFRVSFG